MRDELYILYKLNQMTISECCLYTLSYLCLIKKHKNVKCQCGLLLTKSHTY